MKGKRNEKRKGGENQADIVDQRSSGVDAGACPWHDQGTANRSLYLEEWEQRWKI